MKKIITGLFAIAAFTFSASAQDQQNSDVQRRGDRQGYHKGHEGRGHEGRGMGAMEKLNLSDAQKQQIKSINDDFRSRMQSLEGNDNLLVKDAKAQRKALMEERKNKTLAVLTPEQRTQFEQFRKDHKDGDKGDWKNKNKAGDWKEKRKSEDGKEKVKVKTT